MFDDGSDSRQIFFLYPSRHIEATVVYEIIKQEFEVFVLQHYSQLSKVCRLVKNPLVYINVDINPRGLNWNDFISEILSTHDKDMIEIRLLTSGDKADTGINFKLPVISLSSGVQACAAAILKELQLIEARGRRKYVRAHIDDPHRASFSLKKGGTMYTGSILDISTNGMACTFQKNLQLMVDSYVSDLQLRLDGVVMSVAGKVVALRSGEVSVYVILFDYKVTYKYREKIQYFVYHTQQRLLQNELKNVK